MFTGIVEGTGTVVALAAAPDGSAARLRLAAPWLAGDLAAGDSVERIGDDLRVIATPEGSGEPGTGAPEDRAREGGG